MNQSETASLVQKFIKKGYKVVTNYTDADVILINTCTVTHRSDAKCRQAIRKFSKVNSQATIIVAGCYAQVSPDDISSIPGVDYIFGLQDKFSLFDYFKSPGKKDTPCVVVNPVDKTSLAVSTQGAFHDRTRALVKIQDGCNQKCSYCIVPYTRGRARSVDENIVIHQIKNLISQGFKEIVLTGVHIGKYGKDRMEKESLAKLLEKITTLPHLGRTRLSSIDSVDITDRLISVMNNSDKICNHFHVPLQSGNNRILKLMNRPYTVNEYIDKINSVLSSFEKIGLGTDVITGFPGESDHDFSDTYRIISQIPFSYLHVFPYSERKLTKAFSMSGKIDPGLRIRRAQRLRKLGFEKKKEFMSLWIDKTAEVLFENQNKNGKIQGFSAEYIPIKTEFHKELVNSIALVKIKNMKNNYLTAKIKK